MYRRLGSIFKSQEIIVEVGLLDSSKRIDNFSRNIRYKIPTYSAHSLHRRRELCSSELLRIVW